MEKTPIVRKPLFKIGNYGLHLIQYPSGRWGFVGSIPEVLCIEKQTKFGPQMDSPVFETEAEGLAYFESKKHLLK